MEDEGKKIIKLSALELLKLAGDIAVAPFVLFTKDKGVGVEFNELLEKHSIDRQNLAKKIYVLKTKGYIRKFSEGKSQYFEITPKGLDKLAKCRLSDIKVERPSVWDCKWRVIIFDIPEKDRFIRDGIRLCLYQIGFKQIQKSVFVYPFECSNEISFICQRYGGREYIKYMISEIIEGEESIILDFLSSGILLKEDLKKK